MGKTVIDEWGEHLVTEHKNGIVTSLLVKPSEKYKEKMAKKNKDRQKYKEEKRKKQEKEKLIQDKMRELAIKELEKEGKL